MLVLALSLVGLLTGEGITAGQRFLLVALHLSVAGVLVPVMHRTSTVRARLAAAAS